MNYFRIETTVPKDHKIVLENLPFKVGEPLEILVLGIEEKKPTHPPHTLRGRRIKYLSPTEPLPLDDWEILM